mgnify:CR=1 FL=1
MVIMEIRKEELIKGTEIAGVGTYLEIGSGATLTCLSEIFLADAVSSIFLGFVKGFIGSCEKRFLMIVFVMKL